MRKKDDVLNNKGFSLVELIIVMAIMAILVGAIAPQVMKYVERSRESKDIQLTNTIFTAVSTSIATDEDATVPAAGDLDDYTAAVTDLASLLGGDIDTDAKVVAKCVSKKGKAAPGVSITYDSSTSKISVKIGGLTAVTN